MSLTIDQQGYFTSAYINRIQAQSADTTAVADTQSSDDAPSAAAPPTGSGTPLLSSDDVRLLLLRDVRGASMEGYKNILEQFYSDPGNRDDPVGFLKNLTPEGIDLLRQAQSLPEGAHINVRGLSTEEALNLILPHSGKVDLDNDGIVAGANGGKMFMFPPPNAPQDVKDAWMETTRGMSDSDQMMLSGKFMSMFIMANIHVDESGNVTRAAPGEPGWRNIFAEDDFYYADAIDQFKQSNDFGRPFNTSEMYERMNGLLAKLEQVFDNHGVV